MNNPSKKKIETQRTSDPFLRRKGIANTEENIQAIVRNLLDRSILVLFSGDIVMRTYVKKFGIAAIDEIKRLAPNNLQSDGEHLTPEGYRTVAEKKFPLVRNLINKLGKK